MPRLQGVRERFAADMMWVVDLEPGRRTMLDPRKGTVSPGLVDPGGVIMTPANAMAIVIVDVRCSEPDVAIWLTIGAKQYGPHVGPWLAERTSDLHHLLQVYHDAVLSDRPAESLTILAEAMDKTGTRSGNLRSLIVPHKTMLVVAAELAQGIREPRTGVQVYLRTLLTRDVA